MSETLPKSTPEISFIPFCDGGALFYPGIQRLWALNYLASYIWLSLDKNSSKADLVNELAEKFSINAKIIEQDLTQILEHFKSEGLLEGCRPNQPEINKEINFLLTDGQEYDQQKYSEIFDSFSCLIEFNNFSCQIHFPDKDLLSNFKKLYHYFIIEEHNNIEQIIFIVPTQENNNNFDIYLNKKCVHKNIHSLQIDSIIHFIFFSNCAKYLSKQEKLMFHAAALQKAGKTIVMPANSGSGKSTLTAALSSADWRCFTDELAVFDREELSLIPLPIPMRIRSGSFTPLLPFYPNIPELPVYQDLYENQIRWIILPKDKLAAKSTSVQITTLIFPRYSENAKTSLVSLDKFFALERLTVTGSSERDMTLEDAKAMVRLIEQTPCFELIFSDLQEAITAIESITTVTGARHSRAGGNPES